MSDNLPELPEYLFHKKRANITEIGVVELFKKCDAPESMRVWARSLIADGWTIHTVNQKRGRCYYREKIITIPLWVITREKSEIRWYIAHEMAHAMNKKHFGYCDSHGPNFMYWLKEICPLGDQYHEHSYKPRNATQAGISEIGEL